VELLRYLLGGVSLLCGTLVVIASYVREISNFKNRNRENGKWSSPTPVLGPVLIVVGYATLPIEFSSWIFLVVVLDPDTVLTILNIPYLFKGLRG